MHWDFGTRRKLDNGKEAAYNRDAYYSCPERDYEQAFGGQVISILRSKMVGSSIKELGYGVVIRSVKDLKGSAVLAEGMAMTGKVKTADK